MYIPRARVDPPILPLSTTSHGGDGGENVPGVVVVFSGGVPRARVMTLASGPLEIGRSDAGPGKLEDGRVSRRHALVAFDGGRCVVTDLGSQNGTCIDGELVAAHAPTPAQRVIRMGDSLLVPYADVRPFDRAGVRSIDGFVRGPAMQAILEEAARAARTGTTLHVRGERGTGKEGVVQAFHRASTRATRPLVAVNCAAIPRAIAERLLFGARRGAYSGAGADALGYLQEADGGTLFLDEMSELDLQIQAKLLHVLESQELLPLGASKPQELLPLGASKPHKVDFALCSATSKDLRALVAAGTLREDLYVRVGRPAVTLPALRNRPEEIPALIAQELATLPTAPTAHVSLVEQCLLRPWPGNVRELLAEVRAAAQAARATGNRVTARQLPETAGSVSGGAVSGSHPVARDDQTAPSSEIWRKRLPQIDDEWRRRIEDALRTNAGNIAATARALGMHRMQLRRLIERHGIAIDTITADDD